MIIHFSGHGIRDDEGDLYLCFRDAAEDELHFTALNVQDVPASGWRSRGFAGCWSRSIAATAALRARR